MTAPPISLPRQLGAPARLPRLARTPEDVERFVGENNGKRHCFASVYRFRPEAPDSLPGGPEKWAIFTHIFLDFDFPSDLGLALKECRKVALALKARYGLTYRAVFSGAKGFHLFPLWRPYPVKPENFRPMVREMVGLIGATLHLKGLDPAPKDGAARLCRIPNTINPKSGRLWCVPILPAELEDRAFTVDDALALARGPRSLSAEELRVPLADFSQRLAAIEREVEAAREAERRRLASLPPPRPRAGRWMGHPRISPILRGLPVGHRRIGGCIVARAARLDGLSREAIFDLLRTYRSRCEDPGSLAERELEGALRFAGEGSRVPWRWVSDLEAAGAVRREGP